MSTHPLPQLPSRPEKDKEVKHLLRSIQAYELYAPTGGGASLRQSEIPGVWAQLAEKFWKVASAIHQARAALPQAPGREVRDWPAFVRGHVSPAQLDTQLHYLHRADAAFMDAVGGGAYADAKACFRSLLAVWRLKPYEFFLEFPGRGVANSSKALRILRGLAVNEGRSHAEIWAAVRDAMLARHGDGHPDVPVPRVEDIKAAEAALKAQGPAVAGDAEEAEDDHEDAAAPAQGRGKRNAHRRPSGERNGRRRCLTRRASPAAFDGTASIERWLGASSSFLAGPSSFLETLGWQSVHGRAEGPTPHEGRPRRRRFRQADETLLALSDGVPAEDGSMLACAMLNVRTAYHMALDGRQEAPRWVVEGARSDDPPEQSEGGDAFAGRGTALSLLEDGNTTGGLGAGNRMADEDGEMDWESVGIFVSG